jgi:hypothetical protein
MIGTWPVRSYSIYRALSRAGDVGGEVVPVADRHQRILRPVVQSGAAMLAHLRRGEAVGAGAAREARISRLLARRHALEERLEGLVQAMQDVLQHVGVDVPVRGVAPPCGRGVVPIAGQR